MPSPLPLLLAATITVPFGAPVPVHVGDDATLRAGTVVGGFLVAAAPRPAPGGGSTVVLRPLGLGALPVPLAGDPSPAVIEVQPTLGPQAAVAPVFVPPPPPLPWRAAAAGVIAAAAAALLAVRLRRRRRADPAKLFARALRPLAAPAGWEAPGAADRLARACREFLRHVTGAPCPAMTTRELTRLLAARLDAAAARPFGLALIFADEVRFAGHAPLPDDAALVVRELLATTPVLAAEEVAR